MILSPDSQRCAVRLNRDSISAGVNWFREVA
jgi:hypothetical protein